MVLRACRNWPQTVRCLGNIAKTKLTNLSAFLFLCVVIICVPAQLLLISEPHSLLWDLPSHISQPLTWLFRCAGIAPWFPAYKYISLVHFITIPSLFVVKYDQVPKDKDSMFLMLSFIAILALCAAILGLIANNIFFDQSYLQILSTLQSVEDELHAMGVESRTSFKKQHALLFAFFTFPTVILLKMDELNVIYLIKYFYMVIVLHMGILQYMVLAELLYSSFKALNEEMRRISATMDDSPVSVISARMEAVFRVHSVLHLTVADVNNHFFVNNFFRVAANMFFNISLMYEYIISVSEGNPQVNLSLALINLENLSLQVSQCVVCHGCAKEANRTVMLAHHCLQPHTPHRLWQEVGFFSTLCLDNKVSFTVGEVFTIDRRLITKFAVMSFSYLIVAVQLKDVKLFDKNNLLTSNNSDTEGNASDLVNITYFEDFTTNYK